MVEVSIARLPVTNPELFGRDAELAWLDACWEERVHVASIVAWGGVGKSALVNAWLARVRDDGWRGARRVYGWSFYSQGTDRLSSSDEFIDAALRWFGDTDPTQGSPWDKGERLARLVRRERTLLVLDGVEPLQWGPGVQQGRFKDPALEVLVKELAGWNEGLCLVTSRIGLTNLEGLRGKKVQARNLEHLSAAAGAELLKARGATGLEEELRAAADEYHGHSFSLTLLGSYIRKAHKGDIRNRELIPPLEGKPARRIMATYERWFKRTPELNILRMLGLFERPAREDEIAVLRAKPTIVGLTDRLKSLSASAWNEAVTTLRDVGLLAAGGDAHGEDRLDAHPLIREYFGEQLKREQPGVWQEGHRRLYKHLEKMAPQYPDTIEQMAPLYEAVAHGCMAGRHTEVLDAVYRERIQRRSLFFNVRTLGAFGAHLAVLSSFFDAPWFKISGNIREQGDRAHIFAEAGYSLRALGRIHEATEGPMAMALEIRRSSKDWHNAAIASGNLSDAHLKLGNIDTATRYAEESLSFARRSGAEHQIIGKTVMLARVLHHAGNMSRAESLFNAAEEFFLREVDLIPGHLISFEGFAYCDLLLDQGKCGTANRRAVQALSISQAHSAILLDVALSRLVIARSAMLNAATNERREIAEHLNACTTALRQAGRQDYLPLVLLARADFHVICKEHVLARRDLDEALAISERCGMRLYEADAHLGYARIGIAEGDTTAARKHLEKARVLIDQTGYHRRDEELARLQSDQEKLPPTREHAPIVVSIPAEFKVTTTPPTAMPSDHATPQKPVDLGIVVALQEEFRELLDMRGNDYTPHEDEVLTSYRFERGPYRIVAAFVGDMGEAQATRVTERIIALHQPESLVVVGIAAGVHDDLRAGDVYVPPQAVQYMQDAKASPKKRKPSEFTLVPGAPAHRADHALLDAVRNFEFKHPDLYRRFRADCAADLQALVTDAATRDRLFDENLMRREVTLLADGHVATGPVVGAATAFSAWIRTHDRNVKALEMESAAVLLAAQTRGTPKRAIAIRGISDYGDKRKKTLDQIGGGALRKYAMRNAVRLLWALLDAGALPRNPR
ncbi:hypothetical protein [Polyangium sp. 6x1]|uniref:phosphorylase family protein n=1 Tax=Polyangium sp. 6x1 TaxID=3042689 RepID=UPI0024831210|nr:hypothetical protein [Polyangium sp. 6x1]MDI1451401.1 hypothetical protein [Polyangium sp. 6x1]